METSSLPRRTPAQIRDLRNGAKHLSSLELVSQPTINTTVIRSKRNSPNGNNSQLSHKKRVNLLKAGNEDLAGLAFD